LTKLRILNFLWKGEIGGLARAVYQLVREETARGDWEVAVAFGRPEGLYADKIRALGCEVIDLRMQSGADLFSALAAVDKLGRFDIHHFHAIEPAQMIASARCREVTRVFTQRHGAYEASDPVNKKLRRSMAGVLLRSHFHAVAGNTEHALRYAVARYRLSGLAAQVTYNGIDFSLLASDRDRREVRDELGIGPSTIVVGTSGTFKHWKRFDRLVQLLQLPLDIHVVLVGDGDLRRGLEAQAEALGVSERLHITGLVQQVSNYIQAMDVFVLPSSGEESFGNSVVEAMAMRIPSIVFSDSPGICEHVEEGVTGYIVSDQQGLSSVVERLATDPDLRTRIGSAGSNHVRSKYSLDNMYDSYRHLYDAALEHHEANGTSRTGGDR
jgi:glycosyltransferase involved in cell wall biosynthesis